MRKLIGILLFVVCSLAASAQRVHFIYLQTEDGHPFYLKMNSEIYSSSGSGYLIMPGLVDSTYRFSVGFPGSAKESRFTVPVSGKDRGFLVKVLDTGMALFDMQSLTLVRPAQDPGETLIYQRRNDDFSSLLSKAAKDTSLLYSVVKKDVQPKQEPVAPNVAEKSQVEVSVAEQTSSIDSNRQQTDVTDAVSAVPPSEAAGKRNDTTVVQANSTLASDSETASGAENGIAAPALSARDEVFSRSAITRHSETSTTEGFALVFFDDYGSGVDTIHLIIPNQKLVFREPVRDTANKAVEFIEWGDAPADTAKSGDTTEATTQPTAEGTTKEAAARAEATEPKDEAPRQHAATPAYKTDCKTVATSRDFFKLRKNMASEETDEGMVDEAKKYFKTKCFSTEQIKNLSALFLTSAGKYQFFDAAFFHVTNPEAFRQLGSEIKDDYYFRRFQALIGE